MIKLPRICIDARMMGAGATRGIGRYIEVMVEALAREPVLPFEITLVVLPTTPVSELAQERFALAVVEIPWYSWAEQRLLPKVLESLQPDLVHWPHLNVPWQYRGAFVVTVHDLILWDRPDTRASGHHPLVFWIKYWLFRQIARSAIARAQGILTVSQYVRHRVSETFGVPFGRIEVLYPPLAPQIVAAQGQASRASQNPYVLYVGSLYPHKNIATLFEAFAIARHTIPELALVIVGARDRFRDHYEAQVRERSWADRVRWIEAVSDEELIGWYAGATCYVQPSLEEGFGLPPLEASVIGTPVIAARAASLPEILPITTSFVSPLDSEAYAREIMACATGTHREIEEPNFMRLEDTAEMIIEFYQKHIHHCNT